MIVASKLSMFLAELKRRKVYHVAAVYAAIGTGISLAVPDLFSAFDLPSSVARLVIVLVALGFPVALVLAWAYEIKPEEAKSTEDEEGKPDLIPDTTRAAPAASVVEDDPRPSLAILPFANLSQDRENEFFGLGMMDDILTRLTAVGGLRVISRTSVMRYMGADKSTPEIAGELGVRNLLEGSVRRSGDRVRVVAQLIDGKTDEHLWARTYDRDLEDAFSVQTDVAENIALALLAELSAEERRRLRSVPTENLEAYDRFTRALNSYQRMLPQDLALAAGHCREAIRLDPGFAEAFAVLAHCHVMAGFYANEPPAELYPKVQEAARRALELNPECTEAHTALAASKLHYDWDAEGVEEELARAFALNPDNSGAHLWKGDLLVSHGRFAEAEASVRKALMSDPLSPLGHHNLSKILAVAGRPEEALRVSESAVRLWPDLPILHLWIGTSHFLMNEPELALPSFEEAVQLSGNLPFFESMKGFGLAYLGRRNEARQVLESLEERSKSEYVDPYNLFQVTAALDDFDKALSYLERALEVRSFFLPFLGVLPPYRPYHSHPRFRAVLHRVWPGVRFET